MDELDSGFQLGCKTDQWLRLLSSRMQEGARLVDYVTLDQNSVNLTLTLNPNKIEFLLIGLPQQL